MKGCAALISLGCAKNLVDSEVMAAQLAASGYAMTSAPEEAELIVVNTCGFLQSAVQEAVDTILEAAEHKKTGACRRLVAAGCMVQRYGKKLPALLPEVDVFAGVSFAPRLASILEASRRDPSKRLWIAPPGSEMAETGRVRSTPFHSAYLKVAEGCSHRCSYCMIPRLRGRLRSRPVGDLVEEARRLAAEGVVELNLIAQDLGAYGSDLSEAGGLVRLLESLEELSGLRWIRLLYVRPEGVTESLLHAMARSRKVLPYLDLPMQHCVPRILEAMHRRGCRKDLESLVEKIRDYIPDITLRTSLMVGFPGETETDFRDLLDFVERVRLDHVGVFAFSPEPGARAARLEGQVPEEAKEERRQTLMKAQQRISRERLRRWVGSTVPVLVEGRHPETDLLLSGRIQGQAPDVDGGVLITEGKGNPGHIMPVTITACHDYDLEGRLTPETARNSPPENRAAVRAERK